VHAWIAAEGAARRDDRAAAPPADRFTRVVSIRYSPAIGRDGVGAPGAHGRMYRRACGASLRLPCGRNDARIERAPCGQRVSVSHRAGG
jgi:hypothetical protein